MIKNNYKPNSVDVILLAGRGTGLTTRNNNNQYSTCIDWLIDAFNQKEVNSIKVIGGQGISDLGKQNPDIDFIYNPVWDRTGPLHSLMLAKDLLINSDVIVAYADIVFRNQIISQFVKNLDSNVSVISDLEWKSRYPGRTLASLDRAEKLWLTSENNVRLQSSENRDESVAEFAGIFYQSKEISKHFFDNLVNNISKKALKKSTLLDYFDFLLQDEITIKSYNINGNWAELDSRKSDGMHLVDFQHFVFSSKAHTLSRLKPLLKKGKILTQRSFTIKEWKNNKDEILSNIKSYFRNKKVVVRSSSFKEDSFDSSMAGHYSSILNVDKDNKIELEEAVNSVIKSYGLDPSLEDQILIQPQISNVTMSGVVFTCDIKTGSPYYTINFSTSGDTNQITTGYKGDYHLLHILKSDINKVEDKELSHLVNCAKELERLTGNELLDIEFAFDKEILYIFQVRPIAISKVIENYYKFDINEKILNFKNKIRESFNEKSNLAGQTSILGDMPDWNPAELIGSKPRPLAVSLFDKLITKDNWRLARKNLGYFNPKGERLLVNIGGHPFIDVRNSLNSLTPELLDKRLRNKIVDESLFFLSNNLDCHDKYEFEVATTCFSPAILDRQPRWSSFGISESEITEIIDCYRAHTQKILVGNYINYFCDEIKILEKKREALSSNTFFSKYEKIKILYQDCYEYGTRSFASLARLAFIGNTFLKSFLNKKIISPKEHDLFLNSISTVATEMSNKLEKVRNKQISLPDYIRMYGHLRPGTWDIRAYTYSEKPEIYFDTSMTKTSGIASESNADFKFSKQTMANIQSILSENLIDIKAKDLLDFIKKSIVAREYSKFSFSKNVSEILSLITEVGASLNFSKSDMSFLNFNSFLNFDEELSISDISALFSSEIEIRKDSYLLNQQVITPQIITDSTDLSFVKYFKNRPNFITDRKVLGEIEFVKEGLSSAEIRNKIVFIESADPGYDWIFTHNIKGLITKYGGAASHMAIRASEFNLPAVIGLGSNFEKLKKSNKISLDCGNKIIEEL